jgi:hypothetical protein
VWDTSSHELLGEFHDYTVTARKLAHYNLYNIVISIAGSKSKTNTLEYNELMLLFIYSLPAIINFFVYAISHIPRFRNRRVSILTNDDYYSQSIAAIEEDIVQLRARF